MAKNKTSKSSGNKTYWIIAIVIIILLAVFAVGIFLNKNNRVSGNAILTGMSAGGTIITVTADSCPINAYAGTKTILDETKNRFFKCGSCDEDGGAFSWEEKATYFGVIFIDANGKEVKGERDYLCPNPPGGVCCKTPDDTIKLCGPSDQVYTPGKHYECVRVGGGIFGRDKYCTETLKGNALGGKGCSEYLKPVCCEYPK